MDNSEISEWHDEPLVLGKPIKVTKIKKEQVSETGNIKAFHYLENSEVTFSNYETKRSVSKLDPGFYSLTFLDGNGNVPGRVVVNTLEIELPKVHAFKEKTELDEYFKAFFNPAVKAKIKSLNFKHKTAVLLYGKEGTGKSTIIQHYSSQFVKEQKALVFYFVSQYRLWYLWDFITKVRAIQDSPIIVVLEEIDEPMAQNGTEGTLKTMLDGNTSQENVIVFLTTNYIDRIPSAIKNRKSRVKHLMEITGIIDDVAIRGIIKAMIDDLMDEHEIKDAIKKLKGSTLDQIKQFCMDKIMDLKSYKHETRSIGFKMTGS